MRTVFWRLYKDSHINWLSDNLLMTTSADILTNLLALIREQHHLDVSDVTVNSGLADVGLDSLAVAELLFSIEETFKVSLDDVAPEALPATVGELVALIQSHQK